MGGLQFAFKTHRDSADGKDEDSFLYGDNLFIVAEGVGGEHIGEIAKEQACQIIYESFFRHLSEVHSPSDALIHAMEKANEGIFNERKKLGLKMAVSVSVVYIRDRIMYFTHLGDSRIYCLHGGELNQLTRDHTLQEEDPFGKPGFPEPRVSQALTEGLGIHNKPAVSIKKYPLSKKDLILMTTEGFTKRVSNREIFRLTLKTKNLEKLCKRFLDLAGRKGGNGNMTVGIMRYGKRSKELQNLVIAYSVLFLLIILVMGGYALKYSGKGTKDDQTMVTLPVLESSSQQEEKDIADEINRSVRNQDREDQSLNSKEETAQREKAALNDQIYAFIGDWKSAWENTAGKNSDIESYISFYSNNFISRGLHKNGWKRDKDVKGKRKRWIRIEIKDIKISEPTSNNQIEVLFSQDYRSSNHSTKSKKILILNKEETGWKIIAEKSD